MYHNIKNLHLNSTKKLLFKQLCSLIYLFLWLHLCYNDRADQLQHKSQDLQSLKYLLSGFQIVTKKNFVNLYSICLLLPQLTKSFTSGMLITASPLFKPQLLLKTQIPFSSFPNPRHSQKLMWKQVSKTFVTIVTEASKLLSLCRQGWLMTPYSFPIFQSRLADCSYDGESTRCRALIKLLE